MTLIDSFKYEILLQQYGDVIWSSNISRLLTFMIEVWANSAWKYLLDLRTFVAEKLPDDGTLVPKHVGVGTGYEVFFTMF